MPAQAIGGSVGWKEWQLCDVTSSVAAIAMGEINDRQQRALEKEGSVLTDARGISGHPVACIETTRLTT